MLRFLSPSRKKSPEKTKDAADSANKFDTTDVPESLKNSKSFLTDKQYALCESLAQMGQEHLFESWDSMPPSSRQKLAKQLEDLDKEYTNGGLVWYIKNARVLLESSRKGVNPLKGWTPTLPTGQSFQLGTNEYDETESQGIKELGAVGFVLVAGGLGERLGYSDIKVGLPTEMTTETCYLQYYIEYILAVQDQHAPSGRKLPLCIMTSGDTNDKTVALLEEKEYFGMQKSQITIVKQGQGVPALNDNKGKFILSSNDPSQLVVKPHGHGDIHKLLYTHGVASRWQDEHGIKWICLFQDTNGLAFHTLPLMLGVSSKLNLIMNSLAVPRKAKQAIGAIARLVHDSTGETKTLNVEYNQLDPLLRATKGYENGDENDPKTGYSPFPGNINQLLFQLADYRQALDNSKGLMPEFVNPKYADSEKTVFKKPTRLECMMQDFPTILDGKQTARVGFTSIAAELCFSPVKNATADGVALQAKQTNPGTAATGEADQYTAQRKILQSIGCAIPDAPEQEYEGIRVVPGPAIVLKPNFCKSVQDYKKKFSLPGQVKLSEGSTLVVLRGKNVEICSLDLDGTLVIDVPDDEKVTIRDLVVKNKGWVRVKDEESTNEVIKMRGYHIDRKEAYTIRASGDLVDTSPNTPPELREDSSEEKAYDCIAACTCM